MDLVEHDHHHPPASVPASVLRLAAWQRIAFAGVLIGLLWLSAYWALH